MAMVLVPMSPFAAGYHSSTPDSQVLGRVILYEFSFYYIPCVHHQYVVEKWFDSVRQLSLPWRYNNDDEDIADDGTHLLSEELAHGPVMVIL
ncbi:hypothetical protein AVEN_133938-1 [Araneus ventricosus]|uniref:Uncharacterized protein n=1 Tax=Araneus ventricosus TaxID=182803 RepID=A0A4Y2D3F2_ARAVE|nr:hypothetical protein AVEN_133938-1 [Araneus ventricosus]